MVEGIGSSATLSKPSVVLERGRAQVDCYERYQLWLSDLQVLVGKAGEDWAQVLTSGHSPLHVLDKFTLSIKIQRLVCVYLCRVFDLWRSIINLGR